jgi:phage terminase small subunit
MKKLTGQQQSFVDYLLQDPEQIGTKAYLRAYPKSSEKAAESGAARLLSKAKVVAYMNEQKKARSKRTQIDADWLLKRLSKESDADLADLYDEETGALKPVHKWPKIWRQGLVAGVDVDELFVGRGKDRKKIGHTVKIKISDRVKRLEMIGRHIDVKAFEDRVVHDVTDSLAETMAKARARVNAGRK